MAPRVHIGPEQDEQMTAAVERGGGELSAAADAEAFVWRGGPGEIGSELHPGVRWVQLPSAGVEKWLDAGAVDRDRVWTSASGVYSHQVAEHALALILAGSRRLGECARAGEWKDLFGHTLEGRTVAIVGAGGIGRSLIGMLAPFDVNILAVTRSGRDVEGAQESMAAERMSEVWPRADVVVVAAPATSETEHLLSTEELAALPRGAYIVNVARGSLIDSEALLRSVQDGHVAGAALDVTDPEPLPADSPLWLEPRILITPHTANPPEAMDRRLAERVEENVRRYVAGDDLLGVIDLDRSY